MKSFTLNKKSWHFWLATFGTNRIPSTWNSETRQSEYDTDFCTYLRCVLIGSFQLMLAGFFASILILISSLVIASVGVASYYLVVSVIAGNYDVIRELTGVLRDLFESGVALLSLGSAVGVIYLTISLLKSVKNSANLASEKLVKADSFSGMAYRKFKTNTCFKVHFK